MLYSPASPGARALRVGILVLLHACPPLLGTAPSPTTRGSATLERTERSDEALLILTFGTPTHLLGDDLFTFADPRGVLLPLQAIVEALELPMSVDVEAGRAEGWVVDPERRFALDLVTRTVTLGDRSLPLPAQALVEAHWDDLYVDAALLGEWWPVDFEIDVATLAARVISEQPLPIEQRLDRRARWQQLGPDREASETGPARLSTLDSPYRWLSWPAIDASLDLGWQQAASGESTRTSRASGLAHGDLMAMNATLFWSARIDNGDPRVEGRRLSLGRRDLDAQLLGPLKATGLLVGDLSGPSHPLISHGRSGRGVSIERARTRDTNQFDRTSLRGEGLPGWDVELYRNDQLLDFRTLGPDGRYEFHDVPLLVGRNVLRVSLFGPHGERRDRIERLVVGGGSLPAGETRYRFSVLEQGRGVLGTAVEHGRDAERSALPGDGEWLFGATVDHGLSRRWTATVGVLGLPIESRGGVEDHTYGWLGLEGTVWGTASSFEVLHDLDDGWAARLVAQRRLGALGVRLEHHQAIDFVSEIEPDPDFLGSSELRVDGRLPIAGRRLPFSLFATWDQRPGSDPVVLRGQLNLSQKLGTLRLAHRWGAELGQEDLTVRGRSTLHGRLRRWPTRGRLVYDLWPQAEVRNASLDLRWNRESGLASTLALDYDLANRVAALSLGLELPARWQTWTVALEAASDRRLALRLGTRIGLRRSPHQRRYRVRSEPTAAQGMVEAFVFLDHDGDGVFGPTDEPLPEVGFEVDRGRHPDTTDAEGLASLTIPSDRRSGVTVAEGTLEDPYWLSTAAGFQVLTRPGQTPALAFPIIATGEVDGTVFLETADGRRAVGGVEVELVAEDDHVVASTSSQYDGFYLFEKILPGRYRIQVAPEVIERWPVAGRLRVDLDVGVGAVHSGTDVVLELIED